MRPFFAIAAAMLLTVVAGCATSRPETAQSSGPTATCCVCRYHNDLACLDVRVKDTTPRAEYHGQICYFCSKDCCEAFLKKPEKYLRAAQE
jgi:YHS domain-containing protein